MHFTVRSLSFFLAGVLFLSLGGCAHFRRKPAPNPAAPPAIPSFVGNVAFVNEEMRFVLIEAAPFTMPEPGQALKCLRNGEESAILAVSPERRRPYVSADIVKGEPRRGDEVYQ